MLPILVINLFYFIDLIICNLWVKHCFRTTWALKCKTKIPPNNFVRFSLENCNCLCVDVHNTHELVKNWETTKWYWSNLMCCLITLSFDGAINTVFCRVVVVVLVPVEPCSFCQTSSCLLQFVLPKCFFFSLACSRLRQIQWTVRSVYAQWSNKSDTFSLSNDAFVNVAASLCAPPPPSWSIWLTKWFSSEIIRRRQRRFMAVSADNEFRVY